MLGGGAALIAAATLVPLLGVIAIVIVPARTERGDASGRKIYAKFLLAVVFFFLFVGTFSVFGIASSLTSLIGNNGSCAAASFGPGGSRIYRQFSMPTCSQTSVAPDTSAMAGGPTPGDNAARGTVLFGLLLLVSAVIVWIHGHSARRLFDSDETLRGPPGRVLDAYLFSAAFVALVIFVLATVGAVYAIFQVAGPGTFGAPGRGDAARGLISSGVLAVLADVILWWHVRKAWKIHAHPTGEASTEAPAETSPAEPLAGSD